MASMDASAMGMGMGMGMAPVDMPAPPPDAAPPAPDLAPEPPRMYRALLVVASPSALTTGDRRIRDALVAKGVMVTLGDDQGPGSQADGHDLVVVTSSGGSENVAEKYRNVAIPVLTMETGILGHLGMTGPTLETDYGVSERNQIQISNAEHPLAAGLSGAVTVAQQSGYMTWGIPAPTATSIATLTGEGVDATRATIFFYEPGTMMVGLVAPALRVGFFAGDTLVDSLTEDGEKLLAAVIAFVLR